MNTNTEELTYYDMMKIVLNDCALDLLRAPQDKDTKMDDDKSPIQVEQRSIDTVSFNSKSISSKIHANYYNQSSDTETSLDE